MSHLVSYHLASGIALLDDEDAFLVFVQCSLHSIDCVGLVWFAEINHSMIVSLPSRSVDTRRDLGAFDGEVLDFPVTASVGVAGVVEGKDYLAAAILGEVENIVLECPTILGWYCEVCQLAYFLLASFGINHCRFYTEVFERIPICMVDGLIDGKRCVLVICQVISGR